MTVKAIKIIDPHIHLFNLEQGDYQWLKADNPPFWDNKTRIAKSFTEQDLNLRQEFELAAFVHIEAGFDNQQPWREIAYLEQRCKLPFRSIAFIDLLLSSVQFNQQIAKLINYKSVIGCRYILDQQALKILTDQQALANLSIIADHNLLFELQMPLNDNQAVNALIKLLTTQPKLKVIINHAGSPIFNINENTAWLVNIAKLAQFKQCAIKCSGWEMTDNHYTMAQVQSVVQTCLNGFGEQRVMFASNFPLCLLSKSYQTYWQDQTMLINVLNLSEPQRNLLCYKNTKHWYQIID